MPDIESLINAIDAAEEFSYGSDHNSDLQEDRARAIDLYYGRNIEPAPDGRSQVVDRSVFESIQWILPSLCRIFANGDNVVEFSPLNEEDENAARQESDYLNYLVTQKNPWFQIFLAWAQDALLSKNGYCMAYMEECRRTETETYEKQSDEAVAYLTQQEGVEVVQFESVPDEQETQPVQAVDEMGNPVFDEFGNPVVVEQPVMYHNLTIRKVIPERKLRFRVLPPERVKVSEHADSFSLDGVDYFEYWDFCTISELRAYGFDVPDDISSDDHPTHTNEDDARDLYYERSDHVDTGNDIDPSMRRVRARMIWIRHDYDEDGIAELNHCWRVGNDILTREGKPYLEHASRIPVSCLVPMVNTHRHIGTSVADLDGDIQRIKTVFLRGGIDSLQYALAPMTEVSDQVNLTDILTRRPGGVVRLEEGALPAEGHTREIVTPDVFPSAMQGMEYMDSIREGRTGVSRSFSGVDPEILNRAPSGTAISQMSTMAAQRIEQMARIMASGVEYLFSIAHELVLKHGHRKDAIRLRGEWVEIDPSTWKTGRDMRVVVGFGAGNKDAVLSRIAMILQAQEKALTGGLRVADEDNVYEALIELTKAADFSSPERFWTDPATLPPREPPDPTQDPNFILATEQLGMTERVETAKVQQREAESLREDQTKRVLADLQAYVDIAIEELKNTGRLDTERLKTELRGANGRIEASP